jgi:hypothetical protein
MAESTRSRSVRPLMGFGGTPRTRTRKTRAGMGYRPTRAAFRRPSGGRLPSVPTGRSRAEALLALSCPSRDVSPQPRTARSYKPAEAGSRTAAQCCLSWAFVPYDTLSDRRTRMKTADPSAAACRVRGLATPFAAYTTSPTDARSVGASMGFALQGVLLARERCPSRGPCPPDVPAPPPTSPKGGGRSGGRLQGLVPATSSCCRRATEAARPPMPS